MIGCKEKNHGISTLNGSGNREELKNLRAAQRTEQLIITAETRLKVGASKSG